MHKTVVIDIVGLSSFLIGDNTPFLKKWAETHGLSRIEPMLPAVTTAVQSTYLTGKWPGEHGIVGNGWYDRTDCEVKFWKQSNRLVGAEKIWEKARRRDPSFTCSNMCWWYNMYSSVDFSLTPRPNYLSDGRKIPDCYTRPAGLRDELQKELGPFPLFHYWGPGADIRSSRWIADASVITEEKYDPTLTFIYLPHLDYCLQKYGRDLSRNAGDLRQIDELAARLVDFYEKRGAVVLLLSEYGITDVRRPVHLNRLLREKGLVNVRVERGRELADPGASRAFAVSDHQVAHVYLNDEADLSVVREILENTPGMGMVLDAAGKKQYHLDHPRAGDLVAVADAESWFTYYYWMDDAKAPDFARIVDIHHKPGYDPVEMFMTSRARAAYKLLRKKLGFRYLMDVIPLDASLIRGSHGRTATPEEDHPVLIGDGVGKGPAIPATCIHDIIWERLTGEPMG
jgi:predicted AlkP superfamily pyrophosphatase or phosphodiesterase